MFTGHSGCTMNCFGQDPASFVGLTDAQIRESEGMHLIADANLNPYKGITRILWIKQNTMYNIALDEWERTAKLLSDRVDRMERRSGDLKNEIYQLLGFFAVFQGVVLTAVTQLTQSNDEYHNCKKVWCPVLLTALAWAVATVGVWQKLSRIQKLDDECKVEDGARRDYNATSDLGIFSRVLPLTNIDEIWAVKRAQDLRNKGSAFKFSEIKELKVAVPPKVFLGLRWSFWIERFGSIFATMSVFTGVFTASYFLILCNRGLAPI